MALKKSSLVTDLYQDRFGRIFDASTEQGYRRIQAGGLEHLGTYQVSASRFPVGIDVKTAASGAFAAGTEWLPARNTIASQLTFNSAAVNLTDLHTVLRNAQRVPENEIWHVKSFRLVLMDANGDGVETEKDPAILQGLESFMFSLTLNNQNIRIGTSALDSLDRSRVDVAKALAGSTDASASWPVFSGEQYSNLAFPITLSKEDTFDLSIKALVASQAVWTTTDKVAIRVDAIGSRYQFAGV